MSSADLLEDGFPHATPAGYQLGCRGSHCAGIEEFGWSCTYAVQQYRGDFAWRRWVQEGKTPAEIAQLRAGVVVESTPKNVEFRMAPTVTMADSREPVRVAPKPRPVPNPAASVRPVVEEVVVDGKWRVTRKSPGVWRAIGGGRKRAALFASQSEAYAFALASIAGAKPKRRWVRMTPEQLARAIQMREAGATYSEIQEETGVTAATARQAVTKALKEQAA